MNLKALISLVVCIWFLFLFVSLFFGYKPSIVVEGITLLVSAGYCYDIYSTYKKGNKI